MEKRGNMDFELKRHLQSKQSRLIICMELNMMKIICETIDLPFQGACLLD
jgi:hypothetical protein